MFVSSAQLITPKVHVGLKHIQGPKQFVSGCSEMALIPQPPVTFSGHLASKPSVSDLLQSSSNGICGVPLRMLGREILGPRRRDFTVSSKLRKFRKHEYPWSRDSDPYVRGGVLRHLSPFKPLKEKPKPVTLGFEKPLIDLQKKIIDV